MRIFMKHHPYITHIIFIKIIVPPPEGRVVRSLQKEPHIIFIPTNPKISVFIFTPFYTFLHFKCRSILMIIIFVINKIYLHNGSVISFFFFYNFYYLFYVCKNSCIFTTTVYFILNDWQVFRLKF